jgi:hypothetical protein
MASTLAKTEGAALKALATPRARRPPGGGRRERGVV